jgi:class 3 adenylate cyclase
LGAPRLERKLVAILAADVEGYSRRIERDEATTLATLSGHRVIVDEFVNSHNGRITGTAGDSVLAEFASVVEAVDCAVKIQDAIATASEALSEEHRLRFRIGINVGDVMVKDGDIFGDGVNIAARLETLAMPGGICISRGVRDHVRKMGRFAFEDLGEQSVKNIEQPIRAFHVCLSDGPSTDESALSRKAAPRQNRAAWPHHGCLPFLAARSRPNSSWLSGSLSRTARMPRSLRLTSRSIPAGLLPPWPRRAATRSWRSRARRTGRPKRTQSSSLTGTR